MSDCDAKEKSCVVCGQQHLLSLIGLPQLPLTGLYVNEKPIQTLQGFDQQFLFCPKCLHGQLETVLSPKLLYGSDYSFRTSVSNTAKSGTHFFIEKLLQVIEKRKLRGVIDFGCNDLYLLKNIGVDCECRVGIDPVWQGQEQACDDKKIIVIGSTIEDADLSMVAKQPIDLVVCRHTLEHIQKPKAVLEKMMEFTSEDAVFMIEVPGFKPLVDRYRFDQIFHQHLQYFTSSSMMALIRSIQGRCIGSWYNYHDWGSMIFAFTKESCSDSVKHSCIDESLMDSEYIIRHFRVFQQQMEVVKESLMNLEGGGLYGYGAAQMLPVLAYHLKNDLSLLDAILDDDPGKDGAYYSNLPVQIKSSGSMPSLMDSTVFLTAFDNWVPIIGKLAANRPKHLIMPFSIL